MKIYDDFVDLKITKYPLILDVSKIIIILTTYLLIKNCYILSVIIIISLVISNYCKKFDDVFWYAYMYFVGFLCLAYSHKFECAIDSVEPFKILLFLFVPFFIYFEERNFTEESSKDKIMSRFYGIITNTVIVLFLEYFEFVNKYNLDFFVYLIIFVNSYFLTNIVIQICYFKYLEKIENIQEETDVVEKSE
jgi:hypothetical protein